MTRTFHTWYKLYVKQCDDKYAEHITEIATKLQSKREEIKKIVDIRMRSLALHASALDLKITLGHEQIYTLDAQLDDVKKIKKEMEMSGLKDTASKVYDKLIKHPSIEKIEISKTNDLNIYTRKLKYKKHNIGNFKLTYRLPDIFYIRNLEYVVEGKYDHWHVNLGDPCLDDWRPILWKQIDTYQIFLFVDTLIHYLTISNDDHAYIKFDSWITKFNAKEKVEISKAQLSNQGLTNEQLAYTQMYISESIYAQSFTGIDEASSTSSDWSVGSSGSAGSTGGTYAYWTTTA